VPRNQEQEDQSWVVALCSEECIWACWRIVHSFPRFCFQSQQFLSFPQAQGWWSVKQFQRLNLHGPWAERNLCIVGTLKVSKTSVLTEWAWAWVHAVNSDCDCNKFKGTIIQLSKQDKYTWISIKSCVCICMLSIFENVMEIIQIMGKLCMNVYAHEYKFRYWYKLYKRMCNLDKMCWTFLGKNWSI
jgi:hypothetical protein